MRVLHLVAPFDRRDAVGRAVEEIARRRPDVESRLCTSRLLSRTDAFRSVDELGGSDSFFQVARRSQISETVRRVQPDILHFHGGIWTAVLAMSAGHKVPVVHSTYAWPRLPSAARMLRGDWAEMRASAVLRSRVVLATLLPLVAVKAVLSAKRAKGVLTQDPMLAERLRRAVAIPVRMTGGGAEVDNLRASYQRERPSIAFAGRAETARGIDTLLTAMPAVLQTFPLARLKLFLLPTRQLETLNRLIDSMGIAESVDINLGPVDDLREQLAGCTVAAFPFKYDGTTITPPFTVLEAMSVGLPVIGTSVSCLSPVLGDEGNGMIVPVGDEISLARAIVSVISDEGRWRRLSARAIETVETSWSWERAASVAEALYEEVLSAS
jgi:starch synthase